MRRSSREFHEPPRAKHDAHSDPSGVRITAGTWRTRPLIVPQTGGVRPMLSKTRQALFNVLADDIKGAVVWDCFAGTGLLGFEALSRGAKTCVFIEADRRHADAVAENIKLLKCETRALLMRGDAFRIVTAGATLRNTPADFVFLDPPHAMIEDLEAGKFWPWVMNLHKTPLVNDYTVLVIGHHARLVVPAEIGDFMVADTRTYGAVGFTILVRTGQPDDEDG
ncbi:MAG: 16S rRNA (guanine(966)-N(2))-methyltransferase RsmD [Planctomycetes bacterium]|nr:16S rRNA (guanine(966)-N(2))-methyltransferase RsmD [Planctomycetota bacterium]